MLRFKTKSFSLYVSLIETFINFFIARSENIYSWSATKFYTLQTYGDPNVMSVSCSNSYVINYNKSHVINPVQLWCNATGHLGGGSIVNSSREISYGPDAFHVVLSFITLLLL